MRAILALMVGSSLTCLAVGVTLAQVNPEAERDKQGQTQGKGSSQQPQGNPGNLETKGKGAPAASPQGETPPGQQSAPQGSDKPNTQK
jgi:hypothetical protein